MKIEDAKGKIVRVKDSGHTVNLFRCSSVVVGNGIAGTFLDDQVGAVIDIDSMTFVVDEETAEAELARFKRQQSQERIAEVVKGVDDAQDEFKGTIVLHVSFKGSLPKSKAFTPAERKLLNQVLKEQGIDPNKFRGSKTLFVSEEYDELEGFISKRRNDFANLGIPFPLGKSMHLVRLVNIVEAEELAKKTQVEIQGLIDKLKAVYPNQITPEAVKLGSFYNKGDYKSPDALDRLFRFDIKWLHFGVPDILKEIDSAAWERERERTAKVWREAKEQGMLLLRQTFAEMVERLVDTVTPGEDGIKKRFFGTAITNMTEFFEVFENRNLAGDEELAAQVRKMKKLVSNKDIKAFKDDDALRKTVQSAGSEISKQLKSLVVKASTREFSFDE